MKHFCSKSSFSTVSHAKTEIFCNKLCAPTVYIYLMQTSGFILIFFQLLSQSKARLVMAIQQMRIGIMIGSWIYLYVSKIEYISLLDHFDFVIKTASKFHGALNRITYMEKWLATFTTSKSKTK